MRERLLSWLWHYLLAISAAVLVLLLNLLLARFFEVSSPFLLCLLAVLVSAWLGGFGPGILATLSLAGAIDYLFLPPQTILAGNSPEQNWSLLVFVVEGVLISLLGASLRRVEAKLRRREHSYRALIEKSLDVTALIGADGAITHATPANVQVLDYAANEFVGRNLFDLIHPDDAPAIRKLFAKLLEQPGESVGARFRFRHRTNSWRWMEGTYTNLLGEPSVRAVVANYRDITERKQAEDSLRLLADAGNVLASSLDYETTLEHLVRLAAKHLADWCLVDLVEEDGWLRRVAVAHADPEREKFVRHLRRRYPANQQKPNAVLRVLESGKAEFVAEMSESALASLVHDSSYFQTMQASAAKSYMIAPLSARGRILGAISFISLESGRQYDRDDLGLAEELARRAAVAIDNARLHRLVQDAERRYRELVNGLDAIVWEADAQTWQFTFVSQRAEQILGYPVEQWLREPNFWLGIIHPEDREQTVNTCRTAIDRAENHDLEYRALTADGRAVWVRDLVYVVCDASGRPRGLRGIMVDITERKRTEQRLAAQHAVSRILAEAATLQDAASGIMQVICRTLDWSLGAFWQVDAEGNALQCVELWRFPGVEAPSFEAVTRRERFPRGVGLPGRVWAAGEPTWIEDVTQDSNFPRAPVAAKEQLHGAFAFPIVLGGHIFGVMEFFSRVIREPDRDLLEMVADTGRQIGQYMERRRAEEELRRSEQELTDFVENATVGLYWVGPDGTILWANRSELELLGFAREEYVGHSIREFHVSQDVIADILRRLTDGEVLHNYEAQLRCRDGSIKHVLIDSDVLWENGRFVHSRCFTRDITERKRAEEELRRSQERLELAQRAGKIGTFDWRIPTGAVIWTQELEALYGFAPGAFGKTYERWKEMVHPEDREQADSAMRRAVGERSELDTEFRIVRPDGTVRWIAAKGNVFYRETGEPLRMIGVNIDITEHKAAEAALRASEARFRAIFDQANVGIAECDPSGRFLLVNERYSTIMGYSREELLNYRYQDITHPEDLGQSVRLTQQAIHQALSFAIEKRYVRKDGSIVWTNTAVRAVRDATGQPLYVVAVVEDISERKRLEEELRQRVAELAEADRRKDDFLAMLAHELRNPLAPVRNSLQILRVTSPESDEAIQSREMIERQVGHMTRLVDDLLDVSRITRGKIRLRPEHVNLITVIERAVETSRAVIEARGHRLSLTLPSAPLVLLADPTRLEQVFANLLNNAAKYTEPGGQIWLEAARSGSDRAYEPDLNDGGEKSEVTVRVRDTGIGIAPDILPHIFDLFTQGDRTLDRAQGGLGLGLTLVRRLVELHGGRVHAASAGAGRGSEFIVCLPLLPTWQPVPEDRPRPSAPLAAPSAVSRRVLVVDDNVDAAESMGMLLTVWGHKVRIVNDGRAALDVACRYEPEVVLLDIGLPGLDGFQVAERLRQYPALESSLLIAMTGYGQKEDRQRSREAGINHHLVKPVDPAVLQTLLAMPGPSLQVEPSA